MTDSTARYALATRSRPRGGGHPVLVFVIPGRFRAHFSTSADTTTLSLVQRGQRRCAGRADSLRQGWQDVPSGHRFMKNRRTMNFENVLA